MSKRKIILGGCILALLIAVTGLFLLDPFQDPVVRGRRLSVWAGEFNIWQWPPRQPNAQVLTASGAKTEAVLRRMLRSRDNGFRIKLRQWLSKQKLIKFRFRTAAENQHAALSVCNWLGTDVQGTTLDLAALVDDYPSRIKDKGVALFALRTLGVMGTNGVAALVHELSHPDASLRIEAIRLLGTAPCSGTGEVVSAIRNQLRGGDAAVRQGAELSLSLLEKRRAQRLLSVPGTESELSATPNSVWSVEHGGRITSTSGFQPGYQGKDLFGGSASAVEPGHIVFQEFKGDGVTHFMEWQTPAPVTVRAFGILAAHDGAHSALQRAFRELRLFAFDEDGSQFKLFYAEVIPVPYGRGY